MSPGALLQISQPQEGWGQIHRAGPGAHLASSLLLFLTPISHNSHWQEAALGAGTWLSGVGIQPAGRAVARHKHTNITGEMHTKTAAGDEQWPREESAPPKMGPANGWGIGTGWFLPTYSTL